MTKIFIFLFCTSIISFSFAQQIGNSGFEIWDAIGTADEEPRNWNSFKSGQGNFVAFASQQIQQSNDIRSGATGQYSVRIWSKSTLGVVANGNMTLGRINMGSTTANDPANYNFSLISDTLFSESIQMAPDSLVFWAKYSNSNSSDSARVHAVLHDSFEVRDPVDATSAPHVIGIAEMNYANTQGNWVRYSVPFSYINSTTPSYILLTFTTNKTPGGGAANDEVLLDDVELIYSSSSVEQLNNSFFACYDINGLSISSLEKDISIYSYSGQKLKSGDCEALNGFKLNSGIYFICTSSSSLKLFVP